MFNFKVVKRDGKKENLDFTKIRNVLKFACHNLNVSPEKIEVDAQIHFVDGMKTEDIHKSLVLAATTNISAEAPDYTFVAARLVLYDLYKRVGHYREYTVKDKINLKYSPYNANNFVESLYRYVEEGIYNKELIKEYTKDELLELAQYINFERDLHFTYAGIYLLKERYLARKNGNIIELPQEMYMLIAMTLAIPEKENKVKYAKLFYDYLSEFKISLATPIIMNARKPHKQFASCFIIDIEDDLYDIYESLKQSALISKFGGGEGIYLGNIRAMGSPISIYKNVATGPLPIVKLINDTMLYVNQLGVRKGSASVTLDIWNPDILDFLEIKTNARDDRIKAYDIHPAISIPDLFFKRLLNKEKFTLINPYYAKKNGIKLQDTYGEEFEKLYEELEKELPNEAKKVLDPNEVFELWKRIISVIFETGEPFIFYRDAANKTNPNKHAGVIHCSNLCHEISQNTSTKSNYKIMYNKEKKEVYTTYEAGNMVVCNLASINLGKVDKYSDLEDICYYATRMLNNAIDSSFLPVPDAYITNDYYRAIGIGVSNYHYYLAKRNIKFESEEHLKEADRLFESIAYYTLKASNRLAQEQRRTYKLFEGSDWQKGIFFGRDINKIIKESKENNNNYEWMQLYENIKNYGLLNGYLIALMPTGSTSVIINASPSIDPIFKRFYKEEGSLGIMPQVPPDVDKYYWYYKSAYNIDQKWIIKAAAIRQKWIDQAQSLNIFINADSITGKELSDLYITAWQLGLKTIYYCRSTSKTDIDECDSCTA